MAVSVYTGSLRYLRRKSRRIAKSGWKRAVIAHGLLVLTAFFAANWIYQVARKPSQILAPISSSWAKSPQATWKAYGALFERYSTRIIAPELLAALAQVEAAGNPIAATYWRWRWSWNPLEIYRPASSAVGMFQITDGTFAEARKYCIRNNRVVKAGSGHEPNSCWLNRFYSRTVPSHAAEMTAAYLHQKVSDTMIRLGRRKAALAQQQRLAAVIHLCGPQRAESFARRGFRAAPGERCGAHGLARYLAQVEAMKTEFARLRAAD